MAEFIDYYGYDEYSVPRRVMKKDGSHFIGWEKMDNPSGSCHWCGKLEASVDALVEDGWGRNVSNKLCWKCFKHGLYTYRPYVPPFNDTGDSFIDSEGTVVDREDIVNMIEAHYRDV